MRNFEERMAEIQKRSLARITRRRHQLTALCVPLVAALCIGGVMLVPRQSTYHNNDTVPTVTTALESSGSITVVSGSKTVTFTNADTVGALHHLVSSLPPVEDNALDVAQKYIHEFTTQTTALTTNYTIILETEDGSVQYKLLGKVLTNINTDEKYALTDQQKANLLKILELD